LKDARKHIEAPRSTFKESRPPRKFPNYMTLMSSIIDVETVIAQTIGWRKPDPIHWMAITVGEFTHCHLR
jgi:hypothetical protein